jgi:hypothetical protein
VAVAVAAPAGLALRPRLAVLVELAAMVLPQASQAVQWPVVVAAAAGHGPPWDLLQPVAVLAAKGRPQTPPQERPTRAAVVAAKGVTLAWANPALAVRVARALSSFVVRPPQHRRPDRPL